MKTEVHAKAAGYDCAVEFHDQTVIIEEDSDGLPVAQLFLEDAGTSEK